ncbi:MAG: SIS domain-containing protein [Elusimicrobia bacterium]|nr:SIS domain-containing protein [Elusimicrobiota bacterium]
MESRRKVREPERAAAGRWMLSEILEQPQAVARVLDRGRDAAWDIGRRLRRAGVRFAVLAARGSSDHAAILGKYAFGVHLGVPAGLAAPSIATLYGSRLRLAGAAVIGVSQSGRSPDIVEYLAAASRAGAVTVAVTNDPSSPLAKAARHSLFLHAGEERSVAATKTFTTQLACLYLLAAGWAGGKRGEDLLAELRGAPEALRRALEEGPSIASAMSGLKGLERCVVVGRGFPYPVALETALKLKEAAGVFAEGASAADFLHGPIAMAGRQAGRSFRALLLLSRGPGLESLRRVSRRLAAAGVARLSFGPDPVPDWISPFPLAARGQLAALRLALAKGLDPDHPEGLSKVTRVR